MIHTLGYFNDSDQISRHQNRGAPAVISESGRFDPVFQYNRIKSVRRVTLTKLGGVSYDEVTRRAR